ncbi:hypothetical protein [Saccharopolyspora dendranthemae]|uniref:PPE family protein n=1 Tax=Saccharopolyspora dendranthemae TaxID=1181886 RepID=A0A561U200_9PSEU|nr:hypothetical protein [Saccharopolyspora dendranthemae]TWF93393.1 hypothetical protein FHU35_15237 [Saccharopolyspora dendranthemae]
MTESGEADVVAVASAGVHDLARATTSVLEGAGPVGEVGTPVVRTLTHVWEGYFGAPIPPEGTNWNAYTHEQLYAMVWESADVTDVTGVADEWGRHSTELAGHADSLQRNRSAMQTHWSSESADAAGGRLGMIGDRTSGVGERASTVSHATQNAGDALSSARNAMPPPPGDATGAVVGTGVAGAGAGAVVGGVVGAAAGGVGAVPGAMIGAAVGAAAAGGSSMFLASANAAEKKAEAVHVMSQYEAVLRRSSTAIAPDASGAAWGSAPAATSAAGFSGTSVGAPTGGAPWGKLVGGPDPLGGAGRVGAGMGVLGARGMFGAGGAAGSNGMAPGRGASAGGDDDEQVHENKLPTIDQGLFDDDRPASAPVIG